MWERKRECSLLLIIYLIVFFRLYRERITQVETKLNEVRMGRAPEYLVPVDELQDNCRIRMEVAGVLRQYKLNNIRNNFEAEEQASNQNYQVSHFYYTKQTYQSQARNLSNRRGHLFLEGAEIIRYRVHTHESCKTWNRLWIVSVVLEMSWKTLPSYSVC